MIKQRVSVQNVVQITNHTSFNEFHFDYIPIFVLEQKSSPLSSRCSFSSLRYSCYVLRNIQGVIKAQRWLKVEVLQTMHLQYYYCTITAQLNDIYI